MRSRPFIGKELMISTLLTSFDYEEHKVSALPTNPTADKNHGGYGFSSMQMKAAFDALPIFIIERLNDLIRDICAEPENSIAGEMKTGIANGHTLYDLFMDLQDGTAAGYLKVGRSTLADEITSIKNEIEELKQRL